MAARRPIFIDTTTGELTRFGAADTFSNEVDYATVTNPAAAAAGANDIPPGTPVYQLGTDDDVAEADASALATARVFGLATEIIAEDNGTGVVQMDGRLVLTTGQWDTVTGATGGLTAGAKYYLSTTAGMLATTPPSADGDVIAPVGQGKSSTEMRIDIDRVVVL